MSMPAISAIVPTIGRAESLRALLESLAQQRLRPAEVIVADASESGAVAAVVDDPRWARAHLALVRIASTPAHAVRQRKAAIAAAHGSLLLLLDDDVVLEPGCVEAMLREIEQPGVVAVTADFSNQSWSGPTVLWRWILRYGYGFADGAWQGRVIGPLLRFGYRPTPPQAMPMQWLGSGNSLVRRDAYDRVGGFSDFFLHRSTINEDVDLGLKLGRVGHIMLAPEARMAHMHAPGGRVSPRIAAEDDLYNRYLILRYTLRRSALGALALIWFYFTVETAGNIGGSVFRGGGGFFDRLGGRLMALARIMSQLRSRPA
jgi:GT2 family glycosyltransferase